jgi:hypothetical protein
LAAVCAKQTLALKAQGNPTGLRGASNAFRQVIAMDHALLAVVRDQPLVARIQRLDTNARRGLASIQSDPDRSMSPLRTGAADGRRALSAAQTVLKDACAST